VPRYNLTDLPNEHFKPSLHCNDSNVPRDIAGLCLKYANIEKTMGHHVEDLLHDIHEMYNATQAFLHTPHDTNSRNERAWFGFLGKLSRTVAGTATLDDVRKLHAIINKVERYNRQNADDFNQFVNDTAHFASLTNQRLHSISSRVQDNQKKLHDTLQFMTAWRQAFVASQHEIRDLTYHLKLILEHLTNNLINIQAHATAMTNNLQTFLDHQRQYLLGLQTLSRGFLPVQLVSPYTLKQALEQAHQKLLRQFPSYSFVMPDISDLYENRLAVSSYTRDSVYITLYVYIARSSAKFSLYSVHTYYTPTSTQPELQPAFTLVQKAPQILAVSLDDTTIIELNWSQLLECTRARYIHCPYDMTKRTLNIETCFQAVYYNKPDKVHELCEFQIFTQSPNDTDLIHMGSNQYLLATSIPTYQLICK
jgi:hypothetical protein